MPPPKQYQRQLNNPYSATRFDKKESSKYHTFRHFRKKFPEKSIEDIIEICENRNDRTHLASYTRTHKHTQADISYTTVIDKTYPTFDTENILEKTPHYIFYKDKVWSVGQDRYLKPITSSKGKYCYIYTSINSINNPRRYEKYYISS